MQQHFQNDAERKSVYKRMYRLSTVLLIIVLGTMGALMYLFFNK
ncbi:MAG: hypothetical protein RI940_960 [Bacteroidota bacterium]|jgi:hypothetical protein